MCVSWHIINIKDIYKIGFKNEDFLRYFAKQFSDKSNKDLQKLTSGQGNWSIWKVAKRRVYVDCASLW